ncbi:VOC family protein, partial [Salmonella enterica subsp. enterica serovar Banana]|nr:VOC family protein [Salmonella enterica subsp. enterica serovar Banana]
MTNWQHIDELHDISADLPRFTLAFRELSTRLGLQISALEADHISLRCHQNTTAE